MRYWDLPKLEGKIWKIKKKIDECFKKIQISGGKMLSIVDNVLELSRIESGKKRP